MNSSAIRVGFLSFLFVLLGNSTQPAESIDYNVEKVIGFANDIGEISARARLVIGDLNGDSLPDYVLTNGYPVW